MAEIRLNDQQQALVDYILHETGSLNLVARAGCGKTFSLIQGAIRTIVEHRLGEVAIMAFNKPIADEFKEKIAALAEATGNPAFTDWRTVQSGTVHSFGFGAWRRVAKGVRVDENKVRDLIADHAIEEPANTYFRSGPAVRKLVSLAKQSGFGALVDINDVPAWLALGDHHAVDDDAEDDSLEALAMAAIPILKESIALDREVIDFDDMILAPLVHRVRMWPKDWVLIDECFPGDTPVLLDDEGRWAPIAQLVESGYRGEVLSWNEATGRTVRRRVTGHKRVIRNKPMVQIRFCAKHKTWTQLTRRVRLGVPLVVCTEDHQIKVPNGWRAAKDLRPGDTVYMETAQGRIGTYQDRHKHSAAGKANLALPGNRRGVGNRGGSPEQFARVKGGNGRVSRHERLFAEKMAESLPDLQHGGVIATGRRPERGGLPTHFKLDFLLTEQPVVIEIDGPSHNAPERRAQDERKDAWLAGQGYTVVRLTNNEVRTLTPDQIHERIFPRCFVEAEILEVNNYTTKDTYVYDLEVEDTHCYFAHGLLVHNCQDTNAARRALALKMLRPRTGRLIAVGDPKQAIMGFTGADSDAMDLIKEALGSDELPLTVTYRCPKAIVREANKLVPDIIAHESAPEGIIRAVSKEYEVALDVAVGQTEPQTVKHPWFTKENLGADDAVLCRNTKPLIECAYTMLAEGVGCRVLGREIGDGLIRLATRWKRVKTLEALLTKLDEYLARESKKWLAKGREDRLQAVEDKVSALTTIAERLIADRKTDVADLVAFINDLFGEDVTNVVTLCTMHKSKGKEWDRVYLLDRANTLPSRYARQPWQKAQESNLEYVSVTRAKRELIDVVY